MVKLQGLNYINIFFDLGWSSCCVTYATPIIYIKSVMEDFINFLNFRAMRAL